MKTVRNIILIWMLAAVIAAVFGNVSVAGVGGTTSAEFLRIGVGARSSAMGGAYSSVATDPTAVYWNPAGLSRLERNQLQFSHTSWYQDLNIENVQIAFPGERLSFGAGITYLNYGSIQGYDELNNPLGEIDTYDLAASLAMSANLLENLSIGLTGKFIEQSLGDEKATAVAGDIGLMAEVNSVQFGIVAANLGTKMKFINEEEDLPAVVRGGVSIYQLKGRALISLEGSVPFSGSSSIHQGLEFAINDNLFARSGLRYYTSAPDEANTLSYSFGFGLRLGRTAFDYTFAPAEEYSDDTIHNFSLNFAW